MRENNTDALNEQYGESSFEAFQDARDVDKAFEEWFADPKQTAFYRISPTGEHWFAIQSAKNFAIFYAQRCGLIINEKQ